jgi:nicotinate-nucleotide pyrophosphorylase (carboxylating)
MESVASLVFQTQNPAIEILRTSKDKTSASPGDILLAAKGPVLDLLKAERVALNLVQRLCGIATFTAGFVEKIKPLPVKILDTRKTTPGLRMLEKYAVRTGGGHNHRFNLADGILIKDNHIQACGSIKAAVARMRENIPHTMKIEVEAATLEQVRECLASGVDIIMLDNMDPAMMREAVKVAGGRAILEASGGINLENVREVAETGVDYISVGALTHSAPACDISMRLQHN